MQFKAKETIPGVLAIFLLCGTYFYLSSPREIYGDPNGIVPLIMPDRIDEYEARNIMFCTNDQCSQSIEEDTLFASTNKTENVQDGSAGDSPWPPCPLCGYPVSQISIGEAALLPKNTPIFRKLYKRAGFPDILTTFVFSGMERRSIHRPQVCLVAQGNKIINEYMYGVKISDTKTLPVKILEITQPYDMPDGTKKQIFSIYAYWFFNPERETEQHLKRFLYMSMDNAFRNYRPRWAYVSTTFIRSNLENPDQWKDVLDDFIPKLYPTINSLRMDMKQSGNKSVTIRRSSDANTYESDDDPYSAPINR